VSVLEVLTQIGGGVGAAGTTAAGFLLRTVLKTSSTLAEVKGIANGAKTVAETAKTAAETAQAGLDSLKRGLRMELDEFKRGIDDRIKRLARTSRSGFTDEEARTEIRSTIDELRQDLQQVSSQQDALRTDLERERDERLALAELVADNTKSEVERWMALNRTLGRWEGIMEEKKKG